MDSLPAIVVAATIPPLKFFLVHCEKPGLALKR